MGWDHMAPSAKLSLLAAPNGLGDAEIGELRKQVLAAADRFLGLIAKRGYRAPFASDSVYNWGSNAEVMNAAVVLGAAYYLTKDAKYANGGHRLHRTTSWAATRWRSATSPATAPSR